MKYRKLKEGELIQEGDEVITPGGVAWNKTARVGSRVQRDSVFTYRRRVPEKPDDHRHVWAVEVWIGSQWQPFAMHTKRRAARLKARAIKWNGRLQTRIRKYVPEEVTR